MNARRVIYGVLIVTVVAVLTRVALSVGRMQSRAVSFEEEKLVYEAGFINKERSVVRYDDVATVQRERSVKDMVLGRETVRVVTTGVDKGELVLDNVESGVQEQLLNRVEAL